MTGNVAFDIAIGLIFVYLLYSLYATVVMELIASVLGLRAKNLRYTLKRMLKNEKTYTGSRGVRYTKKILADIVTTFSRIMGWSVNLEDRNLYDAFREQPNVKYLGSGGFGGKPSYMAPETFSKGLIDSLKGPQTDFSLIDGVRSGLDRIFPADNETKLHIISLLEDANNDPVKFRILLENWFNTTMERSSGWFKQTTQILLLVIGAFIAISSNVDTVAIIKKLSTDKDARQQLVQMAIEFSDKNKTLITQTQARGDSNQQLLNARLDSLKQVREMLRADLNKSQSILSSEWAVPDSVAWYQNDTASVGSDSVYMKLAENTFIRVHKTVDTAILRKVLPDSIKGSFIQVNAGSYKRHYATSSSHFLGFLLTILALSLGAPFWFDLLNKLIKLRTSQTASNTGSTGSGAPAMSQNNSNDILNRVG